jgi:hypothetical protein
MRSTTRGKSNVSRHPLFLFLPATSHYFRHSPAQEEHLQRPIYPTRQTKMAQQATTQIPAIYRIWFTWVDPIVSLQTTCAAFFMPDLLMNALIPASLSVRNPDHEMLFHQLGAMYLLISILSALLPRYSADVNVWNIFQGAVLVVDFILLGSQYVSLKQQGRLDVAAWRFEDWLSLAITTFVALLRSSFLAGIGLKTVKAGKRA